MLYSLLSRYLPKSVHALIYFEVFKSILRLSSLTTVSFGPREICYASILLLFCNNADNYYLKTLPNLLQLGLIKD